MDDLRLYTAKEVAKLLGYNEAYVRQLARARKIGSVKVGRFVRFKKEQILNFIEVKGE